MKSKGFAPEYTLKMIFMALHTPRGITFSQGCKVIFRVGELGAVEASLMQ